VKRVLGIALCLALAIPTSAVGEPPGVARDEIALAFWEHPTGRDGVWRTFKLYFAFGWRFENHPNGRQIIVGAAGLMNCRERKTKDGSTGQCKTVAGDFHLREFEVATGADSARLVTTSRRSKSVVQWTAKSIQDYGLWGS